MPQGNGTLQYWQDLEAELALQHALAALLPTRRVTVQQLPLEQIRPNPFQVRQRFDLDMLAYALQEQGMRFHLRVRPDEAHASAYQVVFGERWIRAACKAGLETVPCEIAAYTDEELFEIGLAEHIRRRELDPLEEAFAFRTLLEQQHRTVAYIEERIGKTRDYIINRLRLLDYEIEEPPPQEHADNVLLAALFTAPSHRPTRPASTPDRGAAPHLAPDPPAPAAPPASEPPASEPSASEPPPRAPLQFQSRSNRYTSPTPLSPNSIRRTIQRDIRTLRAIVDRWHALLERSEIERAPVLDYLDDLVDEVEHATSLLHSYIDQSKDADR